ncbi:hypothetical protein [Bradyrhizobium sp. CCBAU 51765]|uniref:hypothetical protein n=1 Tax=Bradyrhizobium sp. CCBAU 51765 TaxID=1325102 RepID=UPI001889C006|nr:hypothetical protein [Bradyrhizobium sp. CCBAU 51765]
MMSVVADTAPLTAASAMMSVQSGARLDRLPISAFQKQIFRLIGAGMRRRTIVTEIEKECGASALPPLPPTAAVKSFGAAELFGPVQLPCLILGSIVLIVINTLIFGFVTWLPTFFVQQGMTLTKSSVFGSSSPSGPPQAAPMESGLVRSNSFAAGR